MNPRIKYFRLHEPGGFKGRCLGSYSLVGAGEKLRLLVCDKGSAVFHLRNEVHV